MPNIVPSSGEKAEAHQLFQPTAANNGKFPLSMHIKLYLKFLRIMVSKVGVMITEEPKMLLDEFHKTELLGVIGWNLNKLAYQVFNQKIWMKGL